MSRCVGFWNLHALKDYSLKILISVCVLQVSSFFNLGQKLLWLTFAPIIYAVLLAAFCVELLLPALFLFFMYFVFLFQSWTQVSRMKGFKLSAYDCDHLCILHGYWGNSLSSANVFSRKAISAHVLCSVSYYYHYESFNELMTFSLKWRKDLFF